MDFGTNSVSKIFQYIISEQIRDILDLSTSVMMLFCLEKPGRSTIMLYIQSYDDVLTLDSQSPQKTVSSRKDSLTFFGLVFSAHGVSPNPAKVKTIHGARPPKSVGEVRNFLGMVTYCAEFIPNFSDITKPLHEKTHQERRQISVEG